MRLVLELPATWTIDSSSARHGDVVVEWGPLLWLPDDQRRWMQQVVRSGGQVRLDRQQLGKTTTGWPVRLVASHAETGPWRVHAFYAFFEHAAVAVATGPDESSVNVALPILLSARPDWSGAIAALSQLWDIAIGASDASLIADALARLSDANHDTLTTLLAELDAALATPRSAAVHVVRGRVLAALGRGDDALAAMRTAIAIDPDHADAHHQSALVFASLGRAREAIAAWEAACTIDPLNVDGLYNAGIAHYELGDAAAALACWERGLARSPRDFWLLRKIVQAHYRLGRDATAVRAQLVEVWQTTDDPNVRQAQTYVFHQFAVEGVTFHASERLGARGCIIASAKDPELRVELAELEPVARLERHARELLEKQRG